MFGVKVGFKKRRCVGNVSSGREDQGIMPHWEGQTCRQKELCVTRDVASHYNA